MNCKSIYPGRNAARKLPLCIVLLSTIGWSQLVRGDPQHDLLFFLSLEGVGNYSISDPVVDSRDSFATVDVLYTYNNDKFSFLGEYVLSNKENELERMQAGWRVTDRSNIWIGRFHAISKFWTTEYHHGQFLQTSISRPGLEEWEDESGPMPAHITGLMLDHVFEFGDDSSFGISVAGGLGPVFAGHELVPLDVLEPRSEHGQSVNYRMTYRPNVLSSNQIGIAVAWNDIPVLSGSSPNLADLRKYQQTTVSLFADWSWRDWRVLSNWVYFDNDMQYATGSVPDRFTTAYVQGEHRTAKDWTLFGRAEMSFGEDNSPYLQLLPAFTAHRHMIGVRWDFSDVQSLALEVAETGTQGLDGMHVTYKEFRLQWSAAFP